MLMIVALLSVEQVLVVPLSKIAVFTKGYILHGGEFGYMIAQFDFDTHEMHTWSEMGSTVAVVKNVAKAKGIGASSLNGQDIFDHYHDDPIYEKYVDQYYYVLANGIYNLQYAYDPQKIVIGGGISARSDLLDEVNQRLDVIFKTFYTCESSSNRFHMSISK